MSPDTVLCVTTRRAALAPFEATVLRLVDGQRSIASIARTLRADPAAVRMALTALIAKGVVADRAQEDRRAAATLHVQARRALRCGDEVLALKLAKESARLAPAGSPHRALLDTWDDAVAKELGADLDDPTRADALRVHLERKPGNAAAWHALAAALADIDRPGAALALRKAKALGAP